LYAFLSSHRITNGRRRVPIRRSATGSLFVTRTIRGCCFSTFRQAAALTSFAMIVSRKARRVKADEHRTVQIILATARHELFPQRKTQTTQKATLYFSTS